MDQLSCSLLSDRLEKTSESEMSDFRHLTSGFTVAGLPAMAQGFRSFVDVITPAEVLSVDSCHLSTSVLDSWPEKLSAWRAALYVCSVVVQTDLEIIGTSSNSQTGTASQQLGRIVIGQL